MGATREEVLVGYRHHVNRGLARLASMTGAPIETGSEGPLVFDEHGEAMLDCGGYGVFILGHRHPRIVEAAKRQLDIHPLSTRMLLHPWLPKAAEALIEVSPAGLDRVYFANCGAEAVETALKLARLAGGSRLIAMIKGYHGKTLGALQQPARSSTGALPPLLPDVRLRTYGRLEALDAAERTGPPEAVIVEPVQAEGGVDFPPPGYLAARGGTCRETDGFLILDEIQTGMGRLGGWWGADRAGVAPDILLAGKASAAASSRSPRPSRPATPSGFNKDPYVHTATFAGSPVVSAVPGHDPHQGGRGHRRAGPAVPEILIPWARTVADLLVSQYGRSGPTV